MKKQHLKSLAILLATSSALSVDANSASLTYSINAEAKSYASVGRITTTTTQTVQTPGEGTLYWDMAQADIKGPVYLEKGTHEFNDAKSFGGGNNDKNVLTVKDATLKCSDKNNVEQINLTQNINAKGSSLKLALPGHFIFTSNGTITNANKSGNTTNPITFDVSTDSTVIRPAVKLKGPYKGSGSDRLVVGAYCDVYANGLDKVNSYAGSIPKFATLKPDAKLYTTSSGAAPEITFATS